MALSVMSLLWLMTYGNVIEANVLSPPRGWNSWISYRGCINESQVIENAQAIVKYLKPYGYEYVVIDGGWSSDTNPNNGNSTQYIDEYGRPRMCIFVFQYTLLLIFITADT